MDQLVKRTQQEKQPKQSKAKKGKKSKFSIELKLRPEEIEIALVWWKK